MAVENDYNLLVFTLNNIADQATNLRKAVEERRLKEAHDHLEPNETRWVQLLVTHLPFVSGPATQLEGEASRLLRSRPGEAVFDAQPPSPPDFPPS